MVAKWCFWGNYCAKDFKTFGFLISKYSSQISINQTDFHMRLIIKMNVIIFPVILFVFSSSYINVIF
jgi:hypothetical protein